jgi:hypothetical protein
LTFDTGLLERRDGGLLLGFKLPAERPTLGALSGAGLRNRVESALGEDNLGGGAFCPSVNAGVQVGHREPAGREKHESLMSAARWAENYHLFALGASSFASAWLGRSALRRRWPFWARLHIAGMGLSYVLMLVAFYVDNGKQLPLWKELPHFTYWLLPLLFGVPLIVRALLWHPVTQQASR